MTKSEICQLWVAWASLLARVFSSLCHPELAKDLDSTAVINHILREDAQDDIIGSIVDLRPYLNPNI
ncbi:MAG: hypothetical protein WC975_04015 [Phycisphaerae bacterium]